MPDRGNIVDSAFVKKARDTLALLKRDIDYLGDNEKGDVLEELQKKLTFLAETGLQLAIYSKETNEKGGDKQVALLARRVTIELFLQVTGTMRKLLKKNP